MANRGCMVCEEIAAVVTLPLRGHVQAHSCLEYTAFDASGRCEDRCLNDLLPVARKSAL